MPNELIDRLRVGLDTFNRTGETAIGFLAPEFKLHQAPHAFRDSLDELSESFENLTFEAERSLEAPGGEIVVLVHARGRGRGSGTEIDNHIAWVWTFRDKRAVRLVIYEDPGDALQAVGLPN